MLDSPNTISKGEVLSRNIITLNKNTHNEYYITLNRLAGETSAAVFERAKNCLAETGASIIAMDIFGLCDEAGGPAALENAFGAPNWPVMWMKEDEDESLGGLLIWAIDQVEIKPISVHGTVVGSLFEDDDAIFCRISGLLPVDTSLSGTEQTVQVFDCMMDALGQCGMDFSNVLRTWFFNHDILGWYDEFNQTRDQFFRTHKVFDGMVPASTGIGAANLANAALTAGLIAMIPKTEQAQKEPLPSPLQCAALDYGSSFSRAVEIKTSSDCRIMVSGTASILPDGDTAYVDDMEKQIALTMDVVAAILESRGMNWADVVSGIAYIRDAQDVPKYHDYLNCIPVKDLPVLVTNNTVCRDDLLFEIEVITARSC